ncbi:MAG: hypothetical protein ABWZ75_10185 [Novosphingobium sp.]
MAFARLLMTIIGGLAVLMGMLWVGQGLGIIMWPSSSFMLADRQWALNGAILSAFGLTVIWFARKI